MANTRRGYHEATWSGISGDRFHGCFCGADFTIVDNTWLDTNIRGKGALEAQYPRVKYRIEGDLPAFLFLIQNGLGSREHPDWGSWRGTIHIILAVTDKGKTSSDKISKHDYQCNKIIINDE